MNTALFTPFMENIRKWHHSYILNRPPDRWGNILCQCAIRDHFRMMKSIIDLHDARGADEAAETARQDEDYYAGLVAYGEQVKELTRDIWEEEYLQPAHFVRWFTKNRKPQKIKRTHVRPRGSTR